MSVAEMKKQIVEKVNDLNDEDALEEVLQVLSKMQNGHGIDAMKYKIELFKKHDGLLKRLS